MNKYIYIAAPITAWAIAQILKLALDRINSGRIHLDDLFSSGHMPSAHVSGPVAFLTVFASRQGVSDPVFALGAVLTVLVAYDSFGVRRTASESARLVRKLSAKAGIKSDSMHIYRGHTPLEVLAGGLLGLSVGLAYLSIFGT